MRQNFEKQGAQRTGGMKNGRRSPWPWIILAGCFAVVLLGLLWPRHERGNMGPRSESNASAQNAGAVTPRVERWPQVHHYIGSQPGLTAEQTVSAKVSQFARKRRATVQAMAERLGLKVPPELEQFFDLAEAGRWDELKARFALLKESREHGANPDALRSLWAPLMETYGVAEIAHSWPAQNLLDYGQTILDSLRPGMVYVGGTDPGRFIPTLLNETSGGEPRIILTQNALADNNYLDYARFLYGDRMTSLCPEDSQRAFQDYMADAHNRLMHDEQFPDEPKQIRPGEDIRVIDNRVQVSGQVAVMAINEKLFQAIMDKNPDLSFALEESFPFKSTYANATPIGPIMELRVPEAQQALTPQTAAQTVDYWRSASEQFAADPGAADSDVRKTYAKMAAAQAGLLAAHALPEQADETYRLATQISPSLPEAVFSYVTLLLNQKRFADALQVAQNAVNAAPENQQFLALLQQLKQRGN